MNARTFRLVQAYGRDVARKSTTISADATAADAFAELDGLAELMARTCARRETVTLLVVDPNSTVVTNPIRLEPSRRDARCTFRWHRCGVGARSV